MNNSFYTKLDQDEKYVLSSSFFVFAVMGLYSMMLGSLLPLISDEYGLNNTLSGMLLSAHQLGELGAGFMAGILPFYIGRKKSALFFLNFVVIGFAIIIFTGNPLLLILGFISTGITRGSVGNFGNAVVSELSNSSTAALNILHSLFAIGAIAAPFVVIFSTAVGGDQGWKIAALIIMAFGLVSLFLFSKMKLLDLPKTSRKEKMSYGFLKNKHFWISTGILFFYICTEATVNGWIVKYFVDAEIMTRQYAQMLASLLWVVVLVGRLLFAFIGDRITKAKMLLITSLGTGLFYFLLLLTRDIGTITIAIMGLGFFMGGIYPTTISNAGEFIKDYPMSIGVVLLISGSGGIFMPIITGNLADRYGILAGMSAIIVAIVLMIVCVIINMILALSKQSQEI